MPIRSSLIRHTAKGESFAEKVAARQVYGTVLTKKEQKAMREVCRVRCHFSLSRFLHTSTCRCGRSDVMPLTNCSLTRSKPLSQLGREVLDLAAAAIVPGITTLEIDEVVHRACVERDCYPSPLGYHHFPRSVCTSVHLSTIVPPKPTVALLSPFSLRWL